MSHSHSPPKCSWTMSSKRHKSVTVGLLISATNTCDLRYVPSHCRCLSCDNLVCHPFIKEHVLNNSHTCPGCTETLESGHFSKCTALVLTLIGHLHIKCKFQCPYPVILESLLQHEATCPGLTHQDLPRWSLMDVIVGEVMALPLTEPLSADEDAICSRLVRRSTQDGKLTTGG